MKYRTRNIVLSGKESFAPYNPDIPGKIMVHICVAGFSTGDIGWLKLEDVAIYINPAIPVPSDGTTETTTSAPTEATTADDDDGGMIATRNHCCWWWLLLLPLLLLLALLLWALRRRKDAMTTGQAVAAMTRFGKTAVLLDASGSVAKYSEKIARYTDQLKKVETFIVFGRDAIKTRPEAYRNTAKEIDDQATDIYGALNLLDVDTHYDHVVLVTDGGDNCENQLKQRDNIDDILILSPVSPLLFPESVTQAIKQRLTDKVVVKKLQD